MRTMRVLGSLLLFLCLLSIPLGVAAAGSPVTLTHTVTGYVQGTDSVTFDVVLHVSNVSGGTLSNVTLDYLPVLVNSSGDINLNTGIMGAEAQVDVPFSITVPVIMSQDEFITRPLIWAVSHDDGYGNSVESQAESLCEQVREAF